MGRYAYGGKTTVESCKSIDVLRWKKTRSSICPAVFLGLDAGWRTGLLN